MNTTFRLVLKTGPTSGQTLELDVNEVIIGRDINAGFVINDPEVSRRHARVFQQGANYIIEDLGSTNGTTVNGQRLAGPYILRPGETITFGEHTEVLFEVSKFDPDATVASIRPDEPGISPIPYTSAPAAEPIVERVEAPVQSVPHTSEEYVGRVPAKPRPIKAAKKKKLSNLTVVLIVLVIVLACGCIAFAIFDALNLYCEIPGVMNFLIPGACPP